MWTKEINEQLNEQIGIEYDSFWLYLAMSCWASSQNWSGFAHWLKVQSEEERQHAERLIHYIIDRNGEVQLTALTKPPYIWNSLTEVFEKAYEHEQFVTLSIYRRFQAAKAAGDRATVLELDWFVLEQVEEEKQTDDILIRLRQIGDSAAGLLFLDSELAKRKDE